MTETELRAKVVALANDLTKMSADASHAKVVATYNAIKPLPVGYTLGANDAWCAATVSAVGSMAGMTDIILPECSCPRMIDLYKAKGLWMENDAYVPKPGDIIMYDWHDSGVGDNHGLPDHVGIVAKVMETQLDIIEGNYAGGCGHRVITINGKYIRGYCLPDYASVSQTKPKPKKGKYYSDTVDHWAESAINYCTDQKIMEGKGDGIFDPDGTVTRAELATVVLRIINMV